MKKIVIIVGGIAGFSAGIFARLNGFESLILEKNHTIGGECTGWERNGYHIDGCIHWLVGTKEGTGLRKLWDRVGALDGVEIYHPESFLAVEYGDTTVHFYRELDWLQEKNRIGVAIISAMENRFPDMKDKLEVLDVATPQTYQRYCNAYKGAFMGFWPTIQGKELNHTGNIKGLDNMWLSGQWLQPPGGLPTALITGKDTIMRICKREKLDFKV